MSTRKSSCGWPYEWAQTKRGRVRYPAPFDGEKPVGEPPRGSSSHLIEEAN